MEELVKFTLLVRGRSDYLVERYSERKGAVEAASLAAAAAVVETVLDEEGT
jgi:arsenic resistance protein ArsH